MYVSGAPLVSFSCFQLGRVKRIRYLSSMRAAKVQASLRIRAVSPEPSLLGHTNSESRGTFRQKARSLAPLNGWTCAVKICHDGMLEDTNSLDGTQLLGCGVELSRIKATLPVDTVYLITVSLAVALLEQTRKLIGSFNNPFKLMQQCKHTRKILENLGQTNARIFYPV